MEEKKKLLLYSLAIKRMEKTQGESRTRRDRLSVGAAPYLTLSFYV